MKTAATLSSQCRSQALQALRGIVGEANVFASSADMAGYLTSARRIAGHALAVVRPANVSEVSRVVKLAAELSLTVVPQGGNTGLSDGATPGDERSIVVSLSRMNRILSIDPVGYTMALEAGVVLANAQAGAREQGLMLPVSMGSEGSCQIGGNLATNAGGRSVLRFGMARQSVLGLQVVLPDGMVWDGLKALRKDNSGYDLKQLFIGSEGTLGIITAAVLQLVPSPRATATAFVAVPGPREALQLLAGLRAASGDCVTSFEVMNRFSLEVPLRHMPGAASPFEQLPSWAVLVQLESSRPGDLLDELLERALAQAMEDGLATDAVLAQNLAQANAFWRLRDEGTAWYWKEGGFLLHDPSVPVSRIPEFVHLVETDVCRLVPGSRVSAFGHAGDGNIHVIVSQPLGADRKAFIARRDDIHHLVYSAAVALGGSSSAEHGIGRLKVKQSTSHASEEKRCLLRAVKNAFDPTGLMNPGAMHGACG
ncbi:FAD-binding oxidoreductase [Hydrogenophaga sp. BPS33]|uniref:FAD-binding oxidoreductase n=1 Tax=Hydrogenophaga sp. BPS33 TaxID=2651974 RepID=UPI00132047F4|nr:FAD-binding oxidoreductase [Hydrogenophaga sp. BPS33]QHE84510.1 FAD-binding oxidoreductase [Hydrogenophaga sp. BPS33]